MKANNTPNVLDLTRWIDIQLSTIIEGTSAGYTLGNYNSVWIDKGATVFNISLATGETVEVDSDNYNTAKEIANAIISTLNNTHATMNANETKAPEFSELSHAGQRLDFYLHNTREIYDRYTSPEIADAAARMLINARTGEHLWHACTPESSRVTNAISNAIALVQTYDHLTPTAQDIEQVTRNYVAYIVKCAK